MPTTKKAIGTLPAHPSVASIAQDISNLLQQQTGVTVPASVIQQHFAAEGTGMKSLGGNGVGGYNLAGIQSGGKTAAYATPQAFVNEYVATVAADINGARSKGMLAGVASLPTAAGYATILQQGGAEPYCGSGCGTFYQAGGPVKGSAAPIIGSPGGTSGSVISSGAEGATGNPTALGGGVASVVASSTGWVKQLEKYLGSIGLVLLFAILAIVVFIFLVKPAAEGAGRAALKAAVA